MTFVDLEPATRRMSDLISGVPDELLDAPTPCPDYSLGDLVEHIGGLALAFTAAATKATGGATARGPSGDASRLGPDWRTRIPRDLAALADAWRDPAAWSGMTQAGGVDLPGEVAGVVALDELVVHGWDVARERSGVRLRATAARGRARVRRAVRRTRTGGAAQRALRARGSVAGRRTVPRSCARARGAGSRLVTSLMAAYGRGIVR